VTRAKAHRVPAWRQGPTFSPHHEEFSHRVINGLSGHGIREGERAHFRFPSSSHKCAVFHSDGLLKYLERSTEAKELSWT